MSTSSDFLPPAPPPAPASPGGGWLKKALIGCGVLAALLVACFVGLMLYVRQKPQALTDMLVRQIETHYAPDVTAEEKEALRSAYAGFRKALLDRHASPGGLERVRVTLMAGGTGDISREQVRQITQAFREGSGGPAAAPSPSPLPVTPSP